MANFKKFFSFDSEHYQDPLVHCIPSTSKLRLPLGIRMYHSIFAYRIIFCENFYVRENFRYFPNFL
jgi:hypothetical protein